MLDMTNITKLKWTLLQILAIPKYAKNFTVNVQLHITGLLHLSERILRYIHEWYVRSLTISLSANTEKLLML